MSNECAHARIAIGGEPHALPPEVTAHLATCAACRQFRAETLALDGRLRAALELPLSNFRKARRPRRAASRWRRRWCSRCSSAAVSGCSGRRTRLLTKWSITSGTKAVVGARTRCSRRPSSPTCFGRPGDFRYVDARRLCHGLSISRAARAAPGRADGERADDRDVAGPREGERAAGIFRRRVSGRLVARGRGQRRRADAERQGAGRRGDAGAQRGSLVASTSQPDCGPPSSACSSGSHSRISCSTR